MPARATKSAKRERQYKHIEESSRKRGKSKDRAQEIAARTVNKQRQAAGETKGAGEGKSSRKTAAKKGATRGKASGSSQSPARKAAATKRSGGASRKK
jgi:hypothetical protein